MKKILFSSLFVLLNLLLFSQVKNNWKFDVPDSIKATAFITDIKISPQKKFRKIIAAINVNNCGIGIFKWKPVGKSIGFYLNDKMKKDEGFHNYWKYNWKPEIPYKLLIIFASDSASHSSIYSCYIFLPEEAKWKLLDTKIFKTTETIKRIDFHNSPHPKKYQSASSNHWLRRIDGTWKCLDTDTTGKKPPVLRPFPNFDSLAQQQLEVETLKAKLKDTVTYKDGIFYQMLKEGTGKQVKLTDTVTIHYRGSLFKDGSVFDETKDKPATFPLARLIRGWQVGMPECKVGGRIRLYIPSGSAYGIRTFAVDIPPNNILVFDVEVVEVK